MSKVITFRCNETFYKELEVRANLDSCTISDLIKKAVIEYLKKDLNIQNELLGTITQNNSSLKKIMNENKMYHSIFIFYLKYFFATTQSVFDSWRIPEDKGKPIADSSNASKKIYKDQLEKGQYAVDRFIEQFQKENPQVRNLIDILIANCIEE
ncbi:MAG: hypothetical protein MJ181_01790 [Treponema sp.]|nr:hypothetical protein [Treponema sp.]